MLEAVKLFHRRAMWVFQFAICLAMLFLSVGGFALSVCAFAMSVAGWIRAGLPWGGFVGLHLFGAWLACYALMCGFVVWAFLKHKGEWPI